MALLYASVPSNRYNQTTGTGTLGPRRIYLIIYVYLLERLTRRRYDRMKMFCFEEEIQLFLICNVNMDYLYIYHQGGYNSTRRIYLNKSELLAVMDETELG